MHLLFENTVCISIWVENFSYFIPRYDMWFLDSNNFCRSIWGKRFVSVDLGFFQSPS